MVRLPNKYELATGGTALAGWGVYKVAEAIGTPQTVGALCLLGALTYKTYNYFNPKTAKVEPPAADKKKLSLQEELRAKKKELHQLVEKMDSELSDAIDSYKNPAALLVEYSTVTDKEQLWIKQFVEQGVNDTKLLKEMSTLYVSIMDKILPEEKRNEFGKKSLKMVKLAKECDALNKKLNPDLASKKLDQVVQDVTSAVIEPVIEAAAINGNMLAKTYERDTQRGTGSSVIASK